LGRGFSKKVPGRHEHVVASPLHAGRSDGCTPQDYGGESDALDMAYRDWCDGTKEGRPFHVYGLRLRSGKTVRSITLSNNANMKILAVSLM
jgi:hypothetical protein